MSDNISKVLLKILKSEGLRYTYQRQAIWDEIKNSADHRDAEDIYLTLKNSNIKVSRATVYRTIDVLVKNRLVRRNKANILKNFIGCIIFLIYLFNIFN